MMSRPQVDELVCAVRARDVARAKLFGWAPSDLNIQEHVPSIEKLHELATALNMRPYVISNFGIEMEAVDYAGVHFFATNGKVS